MSEYDRLKEQKEEILQYFSPERLLILAEKEKQFDAVDRNREEWKAEAERANKIASDAKFEIARLVAEVHKLRAACRGALKLPRPWLDTFSGRKGTLTYQEWDDAVAAIEEVLSDEKR